MSGGVAKSVGETAEVVVEATAGEGVVSFALFRRRLFVWLPRGVVESDGTAEREGVVGVWSFLFVLFFLFFPETVSEVVLNFTLRRRVLLERRAINKETA